MDHGGHVPLVRGDGFHLIIDDLLLLPDSAPIIGEDLHIFPHLVASIVAPVRAV